MNGHAPCEKSQTAKIIVTGWLFAWAENAFTDNKDIKYK